jgi:hypothetical protein
MPGALASLGLLVYKAYATQLAVRGGSSDFVTIDQALFGANHVLRTVIYAVPHTAFGIALLLVVLGVFKSIGCGKSCR